MEDLESTLRIKVDRSDIKSALQETQRDYERSVTAMFAKFMGMGAGGPGAGGGAVSTAAPAASTASVAFAQARDAGRAAVSSAPRARSSGDLGGGDEDPSIRSRARARRMQRGDYMPEGGPVGALVSSASGIDSLGGGISASSRFAAAAIQSAARQRAEEIESGAIPGGPAAMGVLRFANPLSIGAAAAGAVVTKTIGKSQSVGDRFAAMSRDLAMGTMGGAFPAFERGGRLNTREAFARGSHAELGAMSPEEIAAYGLAYGQGVGYSRPVRTDDAAWRLRNTGASDQSIFSVMANARLGVQNADPSRFVGLAQSQGLAGAGIDRYLQMIAEYTQRLAMKGIRLDMKDQQALLTAMRLRPGGEALGERAVSGMASMGAMASEIGDELMAPQRARAKMLMWQKVLAGGGTYEDIVERAERFMGSPGEQFMAAQRGGALGIKAVMPELSLAETRAMQGMTWGEIQRAKGQRFEIRTADKVQDEEGNFLAQWAEIMAGQAARLVNNRGSLEGYAQMTSDASRWERLSQDIGNGLTSLNETLSTGQQRMLKALDDLNTSTKDVKGALERER